MTDTITLFHDGRRIEAVRWGDEGGYKVGHKASVTGFPIVTRISLAALYGQGSYLPWLEVFAAYPGEPEVLRARVNLVNVNEVVYAEPSAKLPVGLPTEP
jgi:hypothetical protein